MCFFGTRVVLWKLLRRGALALWSNDVLKRRYIPGGTHERVFLGKGDVLLSNKKLNFNSYDELV